MHRGRGQIRISDFFVVQFRDEKRWFLREHGGILLDFELVKKLNYRISEGFSRTVVRGYFRK